MRAGLSSGSQKVSRPYNGGVPGKRSTTPLFDLLQQGRGRGVEVRAPEPEVERPGPAAPSPARASSRGLSARFADAPIRLVGGVVQMPVAYAAVAVAVALGAVLGSWSLGFRRGEAHAKADQAYLESVMSNPSPIVEPDGRSPGARDGANPPNEPQGRPAPPDPAGPAPFLTAAGESRTDPRVPRHNYLYLAAQLEEGSATSAIAHLQSRGIEAFAEIDPRTLRRKNGPLYSLIAARGFPSDEVRSETARRFKEQVLAAGAAWKQAGGKWDFADAYWKLYSPKQGG